MNTRDKIECVLLGLFILVVGGFFVVYGCAAFWATVL